MPTRIRATVTPDPRAFTYDGAGNIATDVRSGVTYAYTYNNANRLKTVSQSGNLIATYTYNLLFCAPARAGGPRAVRSLRCAADSRRAWKDARRSERGRVITNSGSANGTIHTVHDIFGNILAELDAT